MEKTTITINGAKCVILPAPKGAFHKRAGGHAKLYVADVANATPRQSMIAKIFPSLLIIYDKEQ